MSAAVVDRIVVHIAPVVVAAVELAVAVDHTAAAAAADHTAAAAAGHTAAGHTAADHTAAAAAGHTAAVVDHSAAGHTEFAATDRFASVAGYQTHLAVAPAGSGSRLGSCCVAVADPKQPGIQTHWLLLTTVQNYHLRTTTEPGSCCCLLCLLRCSRCTRRSASAAARCADESRWAYLHSLHLRWWIHRLRCLWVWLSPVHSVLQRLQTAHLHPLLGYLCSMGGLRMRGQWHAPAANIVAKTSSSCCRKIHSISP